MGGFRVVSPGEVITLPDSGVRIQPQISPERRIKKGRFAVVVMAEAPANNYSWDTVLVCPIHSDHNALTSYDVEVPKGAVQKLDTDSWIVIPSLQPMLKSDIQGSHGVLADSIMSNVYANVIDYTGALGFINRIDP